MEFALGKVNKSSEMKKQDIKFCAKCRVEGAKWVMLNGMPDNPCVMVELKHCEFLRQTSQKFKGSNKL